MGELILGRVNTWARFPWASFPWASFPWASLTPPRFSGANNRVLTKKPLGLTSFTTELRKHLASAGVSDPDSYSSHSLRAGGATTAAANGVPDRIFKKHGRWKSDTAKDGYIHEDIDELLTVSKSLINVHLYNNLGACVCV